jgi:hypothetical protein
MNMRIIYGKTIKYSIPELILEVKDDSSASTPCSDNNLH